MNQHRICRTAMLLGYSMLIAACAARPPSAPETPAHPTAQIGFHIVVERGQSLDRIAQTYQVAKQDIIAANNLSPPYVLKPGTVLQMPLTAVQPPKQATKPKPTPTGGTAAKPDLSAESTAPASRVRPKRPPPEIMPLD